MKYKAIGFDYGGVIEGVPMVGIRAGVCQILDIDEETYKKIWHSNNHLMHIKGMDFKDVWIKILTDINKTSKEKELINFLKTQHNKNINQELLDLIKVLREKGYKIGLLSNNNTRVNNEIKSHGINKFFDVILISEDIGYMKPDPKSFDILIEKLGIKGEELVFVDDAMISLSASDIVGFTPILFKNVTDLEINLEKLGVL